MFADVKVQALAKADKNLVKAVDLLFVEMTKLHLLLDKKKPAKLMLTVLKRMKSGVKNLRAVKAKDKETKKVKMAFYIFFKNHISQVAKQIALLIKTRKELGQVVEKARLDTAEMFNTYF